MIIKSGSDGGSVKSFAGAPAVAPAIPAPRVAAPVKSATELALDDAHEEIAALQEALLAARETAAAAERVARDEGYREGLDAATSDSESLAADIREAADAARAAWDERLAGLDALAVMVARASLARMFGDGADMADLAAQAIQHRIAALRAESVVAVRVSGVDFAGDALDLLRQQAGGTDIIVDKLLPSGECRIDLQLGHVACGPVTQWRELDAFLAGLASGS
ncbi:MAG: hypothetical protein P0Y59_14480 [Candidatus Sphingomonas phytovorans]|nr:hypothetical protein [Sphingomonas sp.]WEJ98150.1 MAG: hypothetical protein P0Y59_14480 [Sphingomonas sp.]